PEFAEAIFGLPGDGPYRLEVRFPGRRDRPLVREALRPGDRISVLEPRDGPFGALATAVAVRLREIARWAAGSGVVPAVVLLLAHGLLTGLIGSGLWARRRARDLLFAAALGLVLVPAVAAASVWPLHAAARDVGRLAITAWALGAAAGVATRLLRRQVETSDPTVVRILLIEELKGFTHAGWVKDLQGAEALARSLADMPDLLEVRKRLQDRLARLETIVQPQLAGIGRLLPKADLSPALVRRFAEASQRLSAGADQLRGTERNEKPALLGLAEGAGQVRATVGELFETLGEQFQYDLNRRLPLIIDKVRESHQSVRIAANCSPSFPPVFAVAGPLDSILENLVQNAARAAFDNASVRKPRVAVEGRALGGFVILTIKDSGKGIPPERLDPGFAATRANAFEEHGSGLPFAVKWVRLFDGKLEAIETSPESGTVLSLSLRIVRPGGTSQPRSRTVSAPPQAAAKEPSHDPR
ncbi:MAG: hypothetical protein GF346_09020, partial [Candidatus Eisenbacteria bacterium]|nr:hypothetical protein [Candidatus Latescibacterota bacterium]MBD3302575.1 hypothetical protein [Candidatus Eisenbacteria bacterium]